MGQTFPKRPFWFRKAKLGVPHSMASLQNSDGLAQGCSWWGGVCGKTLKDKTPLQVRTPKQTLKRSNRMTYFVCLLSWFKTEIQNRTGLDEAQHGSRQGSANLAPVSVGRKTVATVESCHPDPVKKTPFTAPTLKKIPFQAPRPSKLFSITFLQPVQKMWTNDLVLWSAGVWQDIFILNLATSLGDFIGRRSAWHSRSNGRCGLRAAKGFCSGQMPPGSSKPIRDVKAHVEDNAKQHHLIHDAAAELVLHQAEVPHLVSTTGRGEGHAGPKIHHRCLWGGIATKQFSASYLINFPRMQALVWNLHLLSCRRSTVILGQGKHGHWIFPLAHGRHAIPRQSANQAGFLAFQTQTCNGFAGVVPREVKPFALSQL